MLGGGAWELPWAHTGNPHQPQPPSWTLIKLFCPTGPRLRLPLMCTVQLLRPRPDPSHQARLMGSDSFPGAPGGQDTKAHSHAHRTHAQAHGQPEIPTLTCNALSHTCTHTHTHRLLVGLALWHRHVHPGALTRTQAHPCAHTHTHTHLQHLQHTHPSRTPVVSHAHDTAPGSHMRLPYLLPCPSAISLTSSPSATSEVVTL